MFNTSVKGFVTLTSWRLSLDHGHLRVTAHTNYSEALFSDPDSRRSVLPSKQQTIFRVCLLMGNLPFRLREQQIKSWTTWRLLEKSQGEQRLPRLLINRVVTFLYIITSSCLTCEVSSRFGRRCQLTATVRCSDTRAGQRQRWAGSCSYLEEHVLPYIVCRCWAIIFCPLFYFYF